MSKRPLKVCGPSGVASTADQPPSISAMPRYMGLRLKPNGPPRTRLLARQAKVADEDRIGRQQQRLARTHASMTVSPHPARRDHVRGQRMPVLLQQVEDVGGAEFLLALHDHPHADRDLPQRPQRPQRAEVDRDAALVVGGAAPVEPSVCLARLERRDGCDSRGSGSVHPESDGGDSAG